MDGEERKEGRKEGRVEMEGEERKGGGKSRDGKEGREKEEE